MAPSVGSYVWPSVGSTLAIPTWRDTGACGAFASRPEVDNAFGSTFCVRGSQVRKCAQVLAFLIELGTSGAVDRHSYMATEEIEDSVRALGQQLAGKQTVTD